jgi:adenosylhomocysteine nucleosidase
MSRRPPAAATAAPAVLAATSAPTAIVAPLAAELAGVLAATRSRRTLRVPVPAPAPAAARQGRRPWPREGRRPGRGWPRQSVTLGRLAGEEVALMATGDGPAAATAGLEALLAAVRPRRLLVIGVAGGLTAGLAEGTLVAARRVVAGDGAAVPREPDAAWLAAALAGGAIAGTAIAADRILADPAARQAVLGRALPAGATTATVDLESAAYARVAAAWSLPYLVVRAVLDPADEELPLDFEACRDAGGRVRNARVIWHALARPRSLGKLWRLRARVRDAAARLAALAERLVADTGSADNAGKAATVDMRREIPAAAAGRRTA